MFIVVPLIILGIFIFTIAMTASPKFRGKFMSRQIKSLKYMIDDAKDDIEEMGSIAGNIQTKISKNILDDNEEALKDIEIRRANIDKEGIEIKARALKDGLSKNVVYCKHCGASIDEDSTFCKRCGKKQ